VNTSDFAPYRKMMSVSALTGIVFFVSALASPTLDRGYALAVVSGRERSIRAKILDRLERAGLVGADLEIICPDEEIVVDRGTPERHVTRKMTLPGYILVRCRNLTDARVASIKGVTGVLQFLGGDERPRPLKPTEVEHILGTAQKPGAAKRLSEPMWNVDQEVTITAGPLENFSGRITSINASKQTAVIALEIFGRITPAEVQFRNLRRA
jgi:transcriptional antiterminator NusG